MKPIIVATDFSATSLNAANYAADMARAVNSYLILLHVYSTPVATTEIPVFIDTGAIMSGAEQEMKKLEDTLCRRTSGRLMIETEIRGGTVFNELHDVCRARKPYAVVMGSQGSTAAERFLFGAHTVYAMKHLEWPVIAVPPNVKFSSIKKIGLATDFSEVVEYTPVEELNALVHQFNAQLHILNTGNIEKFDPDVIFQSGLMQEMLNSLHPVYDFITNENRDQGILDFAEKNQLDLLIVLPKRHSLIDKMMHRSHTKQLVLQSHVPVMALHA